MENQNYKINDVKATNWTAIAVVAFIFALGTYYYVDSKVSTISTKYRTEVIAKIMVENGKLQQLECENPIEEEINDLRTHGVKTDGLEPANLVSAATNKRCEVAKAKISENNEKSRNVKLIPVPSDYITKNFFW